MKHSLLSAKDEQSMGRYIKLSRMFEAQRKASELRCGRPVSDEEVCATLNITTAKMAEIQTIANAAKTSFITHNMRLIQAIARKTRLSTILLFLNDFHSCSHACYVSEVQG
jgi:DNA-directed RNA polymerase specialized sigma subunit